MNSTHNYKYLVVEDESLIRKNIIKKITALNLPFELQGEATNGIDALVMIQKDCPDLVITDIRMPQYDGIKLAAYLYKNHPHTQIIILSGFNDFSYAQSAIHYAVQEYLLKPVTAEMLSASLQKILISLDSARTKTSEFHIDPYNLDQTSIGKLMEEYLRKNFTQDISFHQLSEKFGFTSEYLGKTFKKYTGEPPSKYLTKLRINEAKRLLTNHPEIEIQKIGEMVGYKDGFYFSRVFKSYTGIQPSEFRNQNLE